MPRALELPFEFENFRAAVSQLVFFDLGFRILVVKLVIGNSVVC